MATKRKPLKRPAKPKKRAPSVHAQQNRFLLEFARHGNIKLACEYARIARPRHNEWLRDDPEYSRRFEQAREDAINVLEAEAHRRAVIGWQEPVVYQGCISLDKNKKPVTITKFDSTLLIFLLKGAAPEKYRDTWKGEVKHSGVISQGPDLSALSDAQLDQLNQMLLIATGSSSPDGVVEGSAGGTGEEGPPED